MIVPRAKSSHKGDFGHVLVVAGSGGMAGAAVLSSWGALRAGAGLFTACVPDEVSANVSKKLRPEAMILPLKASAGAKKIVDFIKKRKVTSVAAGPGMGDNGRTRRIIRALLKIPGIDVVLDADGINSLACGKKSGFAVPALKKSVSSVVITPHPGEFLRLTGASKKQISGRREYFASKFAAKNGVVCVLKGSGTVVTDGERTFVNTTGNPGMATGGSGDVLSGIIAALTRQVKEPRVLNAAVCGVFIHGLAADIAKKEKTEIALLAGDIAETVPKALKRIKVG